MDITHQTKKKKFKLANMKFPKIDQKPHVQKDPK
jgi:hypothetical protein